MSVLSKNIGENQNSSKKTKKQIFYANKANNISNNRMH
jgi:hypothetical protein